MDIDRLRQCEDADDFNDLFLEDVLEGYNSPTQKPGHKQIAIVDHLASYQIDQIIPFFEKIAVDLRINFWIGDAISVIIDGKSFHRYYLYSDKKPLIIINSNDGLYRFQEPLFERLDGITIDLKDSSITFKNDGEVLDFDSLDKLKITLKKILNEYWPELDNPDIRIRDSLSENQVTKWMVESFSSQLMATEPREKQILFADRLGEFIPDLKFEFSYSDYIPFVAALQTALAMNKLDSGEQGKIIKSLVLCFGFFDDFMPQEELP